MSNCFKNIFRVIYIGFVAILTAPLLSLSAEGKDWGEIHFIAKKHSIDELGFYLSFAEEIVPDTTTATTTIATTTEAETTTFLVFNEDSHRVHYNNCDFYDDSMTVVENGYVECGRKCIQCNPEVTIGTVWTETTTSADATTTTTTTTTVVTTTIDTTTTTTTPTTTTTTTAVEGALCSYVKSFSRGTYYTGGSVGGSGRSLIDCSYGDGVVKGSIASSYLYNRYGYNYNGSRTKVYLEVIGCPQMNGYYYLDDCDAGNPEVIDFYYVSGSHCQFQHQGVVTVNCYIVN